MKPRDSSPLSPLREALSGQGLLLRGGFHPDHDDGAPPGTGTILLVGNAGPGMWRAFSAAPPSGADPLNAWTKSVLQPIADRFGATALYPFDGPPYAPFQRWAMRAEGLHASPLGMLVHPEFGLWHAWRGALCFTERLDLPPWHHDDSPCDTCETTPCLSACPVSAFGDARYDTTACAAWLRSPGGADCRSQGCQARHACPVGQEYRYEPAQAALHMDAFLAGQPDTGLRLRDYRPEDAGALAQLFYDSVHHGAAADYTPAQRAAWMPAPPEPDALHARLAPCRTVVVVRGEDLAGFASLQDGKHIDLFYTHARHQRQGIGSLLYRRLEGIARQRRSGMLTVHASITARPFFEASGFAVTARQTVARNGVVLTNYAMEKRLTR